MKVDLFHYDISREADLLQPVDFHRRRRLMQVDRVFKA